MRPDRSTTWHSLVVLLTVALIDTNSTGCLAENQRQGLSEAERRGGWKLLFDGKTTDGWRNYRAQGVTDGWVVKSAMLIREKSTAGDIITVDQFENFELSLEYRISSGGNSGIMFHVTEDERRPAHSGPEIQIQDNVDGHDPQKAGWLYQLYKPVKPDWARRVEKQAGFKTPEVDDVTRPAGEWNHIYLRVSPQQSEVALNGVSYYYFRKGDKDWDRRVAKSKFAKFANFGKATKGHICLQDHGNLVAFRNVKIRELPDDGRVPNPIDDQLKLKGRVAFPKLQWEGWKPVSEAGKVKPLRPMVLTHAGDGSDRIFVASQIGMIHVFKNQPGQQQAKLFLDLRSKVLDWAENNEEGLLGLAFHPNYRQNGRFFVYYSAEDDPRQSVVSQFRVSSDDPQRADPDSEKILMKIPQPFSNHNGGSLVFGHDGYLYIGLGDGGGRNDPASHAQDLKTWMGSVLRIDVDQQAAGRNYGIPVDNPFTMRPNARPEIYAYGFRNIWRMSVDRKTGAIWVGDVGQDLWEEINIVTRGGNYGWSIREATHPFGNAPASNPDRPVDPIWEYDHQLGKSITGGYVYRGKLLPELTGLYLYADFISGKMWALQYDQQTRTVVKNSGIANEGIPVLAFGEDEQGEVYYMVEAANGRGIHRFARTE